MCGIDSMKKWLRIPGIIAILALPFFAFATASSVNRVTDHIEPLITTDYIKGQFFIASSTTNASTLPLASSTVFTTSTLCLTGDICRTTWPTGGGNGTISTSSPIVAGQGVYATGASTIASVATSTPSAGGPITYTGTFGSFFGGVSGAFGCTTSDGSHTGCLSSTDWTTFNGKQYAFSTSTLTASSPLTGSFIQVGSGGSLGIQAASASQNGYLSSADYSLLHTATTTFSSPLVYTNSTNAVTCPSCTTSAVGTSTADTANQVAVFSSTNATPALIGGYSSFTWNNSTNLLNVVGSINTDGIGGWYKLGGSTLGYASSTNRDTIFGINAGGNNATTSATLRRNTVFGYMAGAGLTTGNDNIAIGAAALATTSANTGANNIAIGSNAMLVSNTGGNNVAVGGSALVANTTGNQNMAIGVSALVRNTTGSDNIAIGQNALSNTTGNSNIAIGSGAGQVGIFPFFNDTMVGYQTNQNANAGILDTTELGYQAGFNNTGWDSTFLGELSGQNVTTANNDILIGFNALAPSATAGSQLNLGNMVFGTGLAATSSSSSVIPKPTGSIMIATSSVSISDTFDVQNSNSGNNIANLFSSSGASRLTIADNGALTQSGGASSTFSNGINLSAGCFAISGTCLTGSSSNSPFSPSANYATTGALPSNTYNNGASGVGATITEVGTGALSVDGASPAVGQRILVKNEATAANNGLYGVTAAGSGIAAFVLTRDTAYDSSNEIIPGVITYVISGNTLADDFWAMTSAAPITVGTTALNYVEVSGGGANVTSVSNSDGTLTISPTAGAVVASLALGNGNIWIAASTTFTQHLSLNTASTTQFSSPTIWNSTVGNAVWLGDANGKATAAITQTCTNQFMRAMSAAYIATCNSVSLTADVTGVLPIANGGTATSTGGVTNGVSFYDGSKITNSANLTFNGSLLTMVSASSTNFTVGTYLGIPASSNPSPTITGSLTQSTNAPYQIHVGGGGTTVVYDPRPAFVLTVSSTTALTGTTTSPVFLIPLGLTVTNEACTAQPGGATAEVAWQYANPTAYSTVGPTYQPASTTPGLYTLSSNNTPASLATTTLAVGNVTGSPLSVSCIFYGNSTAI